MMRVVDFEEHRPMLLGLAYRLLGSMWDAEDVVQEAWLRWEGTDRSEIREPRAFLVTVVSRLALDQLRSARVTREAYVGPWLPEPVDSRSVGPLDTAELRDTLAYATLHLMERLTPPERAVFVLREAFELPYDTLAEIVGTTPANCRQLHHRAAKRLAEERGGDGRTGARGRGAGDSRTVGSRTGESRSGGSSADTSREHALLVSRFIDAARDGDLEGLTALLSEDVVAWNDGGGKVRAALRPVVGRARVLAFVTGLLERYSFEDLRLTEANGQPALRLSLEGREQVTLFDIREDGLVHAVFAVLNPDKLGHLARE